MLSFSRKIRNYALSAVALLAFPSFSSAADIFHGTRFPTSWQADMRAGYSRNEKGVETTSAALFLKYTEDRKWAMVVAPYIYRDTADGSCGGFGDVSLFYGPRGDHGNFHHNSYVSVTLPTGEEGRTGNGRFDLSVGT